MSSSVNPTGSSSASSSVTPDAGIREIIEKVEEVVNRLTESFNPDSIPLPRY